MKKDLPIGISDFKEIIENQYYYIDKSLFIKEILNSGAKVILLPRPRRFGKTLNISMLKYYFEKNDEENNLFKGLKIEKSGEQYLKHQGQYPVIFLTFKDVQDGKWQNSYNKIKRIIIEEFEKHDYLYDPNILKESEMNFFKAVISGKAEKDVYEDSLKYLSKFLYDYHQQKVIILIDEYDAPIQSGHLNNYYNKVVSFMRGFLSGGLKDNIALKKGILTGILRVGKESIFSGLNNLSVYTILDTKFNKFFGLLEHEVKEFMSEYKLKDKFDEVKKWYNGYNFGGNIIYNPWSIVKYIESNGIAEPYWLNTSSNDVIKDILKESGPGVKNDLEVLIDGGSLEKKIYKHITYNEIWESRWTIFSFLLFSGYLKADDVRRDMGDIYCSLQIPNQEVKYMYKNIIQKWFNSSIAPEKLNIMLYSLTSGDIITFEEIFQEYVLRSFSYFDIGGKEPENVYHAFVLGMLVYLSSEYEIKSNRESGYGRYDVMLIPKKKEKLGLIMEFKKAKKDSNMEDVARKALAQIEEKKYQQVLIERNVENIIEIALVFAGKKVIVRKR